MKSISCRASRVAFLASILVAPACHMRISSYSSSSAFSLEGKAEKTVEVDLPIAPGKRLSVDTRHGDVRARSQIDASGSRAKVRLFMTARTDEEARAALERYEVRATPSADGVALSLHGEPLRIEEDGSSLQLSPSADFSIVVVQGVHFEAKSASGEIEVDGPFASATIESKYGGLKASGVQGPLVATTSSGNIAIADLRGSATVTTAYGEVEARDVEGEALRIESRSGNLTAARVQASGIRMHTRYGDVKLADSVGDVDVHSDSGTIRVDGAKGALSASTRYGNVEAEGVLKAVEATSSSGEVTIRALEGSACTSPWKAESGYGDVELVVPADFGCELDAVTRSGTASCEFAITLPGGTNGKQTQLVGKVGSGGPHVQLRSKSGDVALKQL